MKKKLCLFFAAALTCMATACVEDVQNDTTDEGSKMVTEKIMAVNGDAQTKVAIDDNAAFSWSIGDIVAFYTTEGYSTSELKDGDIDADDPSKATFSLSYEGTREGFAVFPSSILSTSTTSSSPLVVTLPASYTLANVGGTTTPCPMIASNTGTSWDFKQLCGLLKLTVSNIPASTASLVLDFEGKMVCGDFTIASPNPGISVIADPLDNANKGDKITITGIGGVASVTINIPVPTGDYVRVSVSCLDADSKKLCEVFKQISTVTPTLENEIPTYTATRAHGKKVEVNIVNLAFRGWWVSNPLKRTVDETTDPATVSYSFTNGDPTEFKGRQNVDNLNVYYFSNAGISGELDKLPAGWSLASYDTWGSTGSNGILLGKPKSNTFLNGKAITSGNCIVFMTVTTDENPSSDLAKGCLLIRDGAIISCAGITTLGKSGQYTDNKISLSELNRLVSKYGCIFMPVTGFYDSTIGWREESTAVTILSNRNTPNDNIWMYPGIVTRLGTSNNKSFYCSARLLKSASR